MKTIILITLAAILLAGTAMAQDHNLGPWEIQTASIQEPQKRAPDPDAYLFEKRLSDMTGEEYLKYQEMTKAPFFSWKKVVETLFWVLFIIAK